MVDIKEIKSAKIVPFTLMSSSISAILAFIGAILFGIALGIISAFLPPQLAPLGSALAGLGITIVIAYPILAFLIGLSTVFLSVLLYNMLVPRVGGVKLGMEGNNVAEIPIVPFALILSIIMAIWAFIIGLLVTTAFLPVAGFIATAIPMFANVTNGTATGAGFSSLIGLGAIFFIVIMPILVLIFGFIGHALFAVFYNYIATRVAKIQLNFESMAEGWYKLVDIPIVPIALALAVISAIFALIQGILSLGAAPDIVTGIVSLIVNIILNFIWTFIVVAIATFLYNFLAPRIGAVKLALE
ncbi:hypothetical protein [Methanobacterium sp. ACI-7]|uniref:hypothetical protein n=1 Tax=unclassified Methanobacterium TaxID=2627676 RepID=UPI0039C3BC48